MLGVLHRKREAVRGAEGLGPCHEADLAHVDEDESGGRVGLQSYGGQRHGRGQRHLPGSRGQEKERLRIVVQGMFYPGLYPIVTKREILLERLSSIQLAIFLPKCTINRICSEMFWRNIY